MKINAAINGYSEKPCLNNKFELGIDNRLSGKKSTGKNIHIYQGSQRSTANFSNCRYRRSRAPDRHQHPNNNPEIANQMVQKTKDIISAAVEQFSGIFIKGPSSEGKMKTSSGKIFWRIKFRIWPGRGTIIETTVKQEIVQSLKELDANYADWMVSVNYEVEKKSLPVR